jgi:hypothetical protein
LRRRRDDVGDLNAEDFSKMGVGKRAVARRGNCAALRSAADEFEMIHAAEHEKEFRLRGKGLAIDIIARSVGELRWRERCVWNCQEARPSPPATFDG